MKKSVGIFLVAILCFQHILVVQGGITTVTGLRAQLAKHTLRVQKTEGEASHQSAAVNSGMTLPLVIGRNDHKAKLEFNVKYGKKAQEGGFNVKYAPEPDGSYRETQPQGVGTLGAQRPEATRPQRVRDIRTATGIHTTSINTSPTIHVPKLEGEFSGGGNSQHPTPNNVKISPRMKLDTKKDIVPDGPYVYGVATTTLFNATGHGAVETKSFFGLKIPAPTQLINPQTGLPYGRNIAINHRFPVLRHNVQDAEYGTFWGVTGEQFNEVGMGMGFKDVPLANDKKHGVAVWINGFWDLDIEYQHRLEKLATWGKYTLAIAYHPGDYTFTDQTTIIGERVNDAKNALDQLLARNADPNDPIFNLIDTTDIQCKGHSYGGEACRCLVSGCTDLGIAADPRFKIANLDDPSNWVEPYVFESGKDFKLFGLYSEDAAAYQAWWRPHGGNSNQVLNAAAVVNGTVHQMYQIHDCQLAKLAINLNITADSFAWAYPGISYAWYCVNPSANGFKTNPPVALQTLMNIGLKMDNLIVQGVAGGDSTLQANFFEKNIYALEAQNGWNMLYYGRHHCGNLPCQAITTAEEVHRDTQIYAPSGSSSDQFDSSFSASPPTVNTDCPGVTLWGNVYIKDNGKTAIKMFQPTCSQLQAATCSDGAYPISECQ